MRKLGGGGFAVALAALALGTAPGASAATEVGNDLCPANESFTGFMAIQLSDSSGSLPLAVPAAGVATKWKVESLLANKPQVLKVVRPTGKKNEFRVVGESTSQTVLVGQNAFETRIPVQPGDQFGLYGASPSGALYCTGAVAKPTDVMGHFGGNLQSTEAPMVFGEFKSARVAVSAIVEPDADGDGYGDETQDKCPQSAAFQADCALISLDQFAVVGRSSITVLVIADHEAPVTVTATSKAGKSSRRHGLKSGGVTLKGTTQTVSPNKLFKFKLKFNSKLKSQLAALPHGKSLKLTVTASAKNLVGQVSTRTTTVKLRG
jgi:hypothetical protein